MEIDPRFKSARKHAARRKRKTWLVPLLVWGGGGLILAGVPLGLFLAGVLTFGTQQQTPQNTAGDKEVPAPKVSYASPFVDVAGDPMVLRFDRSAGAERSKVILRPPDVPPIRAGSDLVLLRDDMITSQDRLITTLPSSREDFAFFQAQRQAPLSQPRAPTVQPAAADTRDQVIVVENGGASWGESLTGSDDTAPDQFIRTRIENTTSLTYLRRDDQRPKSHEDIFLRLREPRTLLDVLNENGLDKQASQRFAETATALLPDLANLSPGHILAIRSISQGAGQVPVQLSAYTSETYIGSLALSDTGDLVTGADPWVAEDLFSFADTPVAAQADTSRKYRLLDAFYSAAMRNGVPSAIVGETIVMMSQSFDLESFARPGDSMTLIYARNPGSEGSGPGQILYAAISGPGGRMLECNVYRPQGQSEYACFGKGGSGGGVHLRQGMVTPVQGVMTSGYGPRMHPILKTAKLHRGVDWAAPTGTPVMAAFDGKIIAAGDGRGYGNLVRIGHPDGTETRYAHLNKFSDLARVGQKVRAGDVIGYVGTTGLSTGPHLHFELYEKGKSVDPFAAVGGTLTASSAVEQLTDRIIRVESGGKADAKNPLSSATGLGQFIDSTWVRMMKTYRPDLSSTLSRAELLALRFDPTISREMVQNLAREGESYLAARGHQITAGRLYLAHFLGAEGAHTVLSSNDSSLILDVMGAGVVSANPFLKGRDVAYIKAWAERKMRGRGGPPPPPPVPPEVRAYQKVMTRLLKEA